MTDHKFTDAEIVKALECCSPVVSEDFDCVICPYNKKGCNSKLLRDALSLINRQKAEIERIQKERRFGMTIFKLDAIEAHAKRKAIKEFAREHREIMLAYCDDDDQISLKVCEFDASTNNLVKEMTEASK